MSTPASMQLPRTLTAPLAKRPAPRRSRFWALAAGFGLMVSSAMAQTTTPQPKAPVEATLA